MEIKDTAIAVRIKYCVFIAREVLIIAIITNTASTIEPIILTA